MKTKNKLKVLAVGLLLLSGCSNTGSGSSGQGLTDEGGTSLENPVRLDQLGVLPASNSSAASYLLQLTNYSKDKYTLDSVRVIDLDTGKDSKLISVASQACNAVVANGSCSIQLTPHTAQSADVKLEVNLKDSDGLSTTLVQLIRISGELSANNGGIVMLNDVDRIITEDGNYSLSIPVVLGDSYDDIKASNGSLICNTTGYQKGSSCTYQLSGKISGTSAVVSTRLEGIKAGKTAIVQEANAKVEVTKGAHLLLSHGTTINDPATSGEITVFNNGNIPATDLAASVEPTTGLKIETAAANACGTSLAQGATCKVKVSVKSTTNGQDPVKVAYKDGTTANIVQTNVRYKVANAVAGVTFTVQSNNLANAIIGGKTRAANVNIKNTGNRTLENVSYYLAPAGSSELTLVKPASNGCNLTGAKLGANESCNLTVKYTPTTVQASKSINLVLNGKYTDQNGQSHALVKAQGLTYSASNASSGNLVWKVTTGNGNLSIINNDINVESATWELKNTLALDENLPAKGVSVTLNPSDINGLKVEPTNAVTCPLSSADIAGDSTCQYKVSYGPTRVEQAQTDVNLKAAYNFYTGTIESSSAGFKVASSAAPQPKIEVSVAISGTPVTGDGSQAKPWSFTAYDNKTISLKYTFKNTGTLKADKFNLDTGNLPTGAALKDTTCANGAVETDLALGASCIANIDIPDPELFNVPNLINGNLNSANLQLDLPYNYKFNGKLYRGQGDTKYVKFNRLWANVSHAIQATTSTDSAYEFEVKSQVTGLDNAAKSYPITITPTLSNPIAGVTLAPCTIPDTSKDSCINKISLPKNMFVGGSELLVTFRTLANGLDAKNAIVSDYSVGSTVVPISNQTGLVAAFQGDTSGKLFLLEKDIALAGQWTPVRELKNATFDGQRHKITNLDINSSGNVNTGFFAATNNVIIKNLNLQGKASTTNNNGIGLLIGRADNSLTLLNSNFNSTVTGNDDAGGVIGTSYGEMIIEAVTVKSKVYGNNAIGGLVAYPNYKSTFKNIRVNTEIEMTGNTAGGVSAYLHDDDKLENGYFSAENILVNATMNINSRRGSIGGVFGATRFGVQMSNIDATIDINIAGPSLGDRIGGIVGNLNYSAYKDNHEISNLISRGVIKSSHYGLDNPANRISGIASSETIAIINNAIDLTTLTYSNGATNANYVSPLTSTKLNAYGNSANVYYALPAVATYITAANPSFVAQLTGDTAVAQKSFLEGKGFDFTNTWTIKKDSANNEIIGIKEDSIPQFPKW